MGNLDPTTITTIIIAVDAANITVVMRGTIATVIFLAFFSVIVPAVSAVFFPSSVMSILSFTIPPFLLLLALLLSTFLLSAFLLLTFHLALLTLLLHAFCAFLLLPHAPCSLHSQHVPLLWFVDASFPLLACLSAACT